MGASISSRSSPAGSTQPVAAAHRHPGRPRWRGRRVGPLVREPLPVVVRAASSTESRGRPLTHRNRDRGHAGQLTPGHADAAPAHPAPRSRLRGADPRDRARRGRPHPVAVPTRSTTCSHPPPLANDSALADLGRRLLQLEDEVRPLMTETLHEHEHDYEHRAGGAREALSAVRTEAPVVGQDAAVSGLLVALLSGGHVLMEGVPEDTAGAPAWCPRPAPSRGCAPAVSSPPRARPPSARARRRAAPPADRRPRRPVRRRPSRPRSGRR